MHYITYVLNDYYKQEEKREYETVTLRLYRTFDISLIENHFDDKGNFCDNLLKAIETIIAVNIDDKEEEQYYLKAASKAYSPIYGNEQFYRTLACYILGYDNYYVDGIKPLMNQINKAHLIVEECVPWSDDECIPKILDILEQYINRYFHDDMIKISIDSLCDIVMNVTEFKQPSGCELDHMKCFQIECKPEIFAREIMKYIFKLYYNIYYELKEKDRTIIIE